MWVFYLISLPLTLGLVVFTLRYFAGPEIPRYVLITVGYTWFCSVSVIILAPADIWTVTICFRVAYLLFTPITIVLFDLEFKSIRGYDRFEI